MLPISVALVEDDAIVRERICRVIRADPTLELSFAASTGVELMQRFAATPVQVLLVDLGLPDRPGLELIAECCRLQPACAVMVLTMFGDESNMLKAFDAGARGYLLKDGTEQDLAAHVLHLHAGGSPMSPIIARQLLQRWRASQPPPRREQPDDRLSPRETEVLDLIARGFTYGEIGKLLGVSLTTVHTHVRNIYGKLGVHNKTEAVHEARQVGLLR